MGQNSGPIFRRLWTKVRHIKFACTCGSDRRIVRSLQRRFPIDGILLRSRDIRDEVVKLSV